MMHVPLNQVPQPFLSTTDLAEIVEVAVRGQEQANHMLQRGYKLLYVIQASKVEAGFVSMYALFVLGRTKDTPPMAQDGPRGGRR